MNTMKILLNSKYNILLIYIKENSIILWINSLSNQLLMKLNAKLFFYNTSGYLVYVVKDWDFIYYKNYCLYENIEIKIIYFFSLYNFLILNNKFLIIN